MKRNPRGRIQNWKSLLKKIESRLKKGHSIQATTTLYGIAASTYHEWKKRAAKKPLTLSEIHGRIGRTIR